MKENELIRSQKDSLQKECMEVSNPFSIFNQNLKLRNKYLDK
jgi:hypothetical protein